ncbi:Os10g0406701, partial [Oryza sativa Japonica Group]
TSNFSITSKIFYIHKLPTFPSHRSNFNQIFNFSVN